MFSASTLETPGVGRGNTKKASSTHISRSIKKQNKHTNIFSIELFLVEQETLNHSNDVESEGVGDPKEVLLNLESAVVFFNGYL